MAALLVVVTARASQGTFDRTVTARWTVLVAGDTGVVAGVVRLQGRTDHSGVSVAAGGHPATTGPEGRFILELPPGAYDAVTASMSGYISAQTPNVQVSASATTTLAEMVLPAGDADGDEDVDAADLSIVSVGVGQEPPADITADINGDGLWDVQDLALVGLNFGKIGPIEWIGAPP